MYSVSWTNTHHDVADLVNHGMILKFEYFENETKLFYEKKFLTCASDDTCWEFTVF